MSISLGGLATGMDTQALVQQLVEVEKMRLAQYQTKQKELNTLSSKYGELESKISTFKSAASAISDSSSLKSFSSTTSDDTIVTAEATSSAFEGSHSVEIKQLATANTIVHSGFSYRTDYVGEGTFIYMYDNEEVTVSTTATTSLEELVGLINNDSNNPGVTASILEYDDGTGSGKYHLVLSGEDSGSDYQIKINSENSEILNASSDLRVNDDAATLQAKLTALGSFSGVLGTDDKIQITGLDHAGAAITPHEFVVTKDATVQQLIDEINTAFDGVANAVFKDGTIKLVATTPGASTMDMTLNFVQGTGSTAALTLPDFATDPEHDGGTVTASLAGFEGAEFIETQQAQDSMIKVDGYPIGADTWISRSTNSVTDVIAGVTLNLHSTTETDKPVKLSLTRDREQFEEKLQKMLDAYNDLVHFIKEETKFDTTDNSKNGVLSGQSSVTTIKPSITDPFTTTALGFLNQVDSFILAGDIGLEYDSDGLLNIDHDKLTEAMSEDYLGVLDLVGADRVGASNSERLKFYGASTTTTAGTYEVKVDFTAGVADKAYFRKKGETEWREGTIDGNIVTSNLEFDDNNNPLYPESGLQFSFQWDGSSTSMTADIRVKQGIAGELTDMLDEFLSNNGLIDIEKKGIESKLKYQKEKIEREEARLEKYEERLKLKYARMEATIQTMQQSFGALTMAQ